MQLVDLHVVRVKKEEECALREREVLCASAKSIKHNNAEFCDAPAHPLLPNRSRVGALETVEDHDLMEWRQAPVPFSLASVSSL